ncbi:hypothetical protein AWR36_008085 [Microbulbifer flavimaris]|uniref:MaoC-like domain-containing protein n=1 Tax=Microbulbifer flavimaris TaxID=1781068 RepID=A0ABX4I0Q3_9GAMM|nr:MULTISPECIES: MaoC/PaaZ C-terminal domain-containing protein [Microbulbifer]KUJ83772.1 hypothetical protein AVO43_08060 [Microbulbifer sp. ZGT114]PCO05947.1 hypothetical protein AWR36_008085 [Microbulbifer flavimaris]
MTLQDIKEISTGGQRVIRQQFSLGQEDFNRFADLSGDHNPIHVDPAYAAGTRFGATVSHGMLLFSVLRGVIEDHYPGSRLVNQDLKFPAPTYTDELFTVTLVEEAVTDSGVELTTTVVKADGQRGLEGRCQLALAGEGKA